jgi:hypothetical protein
MVCRYTGLAVRDGRAHAYVGDVDDNRPPRWLPLDEADVVLFRTDPPVDRAYLDATLLLDHVDPDDDRHSPLPLARSAAYTAATGSDRRQRLDRWAGIVGWGPRQRTPWLWGADSDLRLCDHTAAEFVVQAHDGRLVGRFYGEHLTRSARIRCRGREDQ